MCSQESPESEDIIQPPLEIKHQILYNGSKTLWKTRMNLDVIIVHHLNCDCIELIAHNAPTDSEAPRLYLQYSILLLKLHHHDINEQLSKEKALLMHSYSDYNEDDLLRTLRNKAVVNYVLTRINVADSSDNSIKIFLQPSFDDKVIYITNKIDVEMTIPEGLEPYGITRKAHTTFANFTDLMDVIVTEHEHFKAEIAQATNFIDVSENSLAVEQNMTDGINNDVLLFGVQKASLVTASSETVDVPMHNIHRHLHARHSISHRGSPSLDSSNNADLYRASHVESGPIAPVSSRLSHILHLPVDPARIEAANRLHNGGASRQQPPPQQQPQPPRHASPSAAKMARRRSVANRRQSEALHYMKPIDSVADLNAKESVEKSSPSPQRKTTAMSERRRTAAQLGPMRSPRDNPFVRSAQQSPRDSFQASHMISPRLQTLNEASPRRHSSPRPETISADLSRLPVKAMLTPSPPPGGPRVTRNESNLSLSSYDDSDEDNSDSDARHVVEIQFPSKPAVVPPIDLSRPQRRLSASRSAAEFETSPRLVLQDVSPRLSAYFEVDHQPSDHSTQLPVSAQLSSSVSVHLPALPCSSSTKSSPRESETNRHSSQRDRAGLVPTYIMNQLLSRSTDTWSSHDSGPLNSRSNEDRSPILHDRDRDSGVHVELRSHSFDVEEDSQQIDQQVNAAIRPVNALDLLQHSSDMWVNSYSESRSNAPSPPNEQVTKCKSYDDRHSSGHVEIQRDYRRSPNHHHKLSPQHHDRNRNSSQSNLHSPSADPTLKKVDLNAQFASLGTSSRDSASYHGRKLLASSGGGMGRAMTPERTSQSPRKSHHSSGKNAPVPSLTQLLPRNLPGTTPRSSSPQVSPVTTGRSTSTANTAQTSGTALSLSLGICDLRLPSTTVQLLTVSPDRHNTSRSNPSRNSTSTGGVFHSPLNVSTSPTQQQNHKQQQPSNNSHHMALLHKLSPSKGSHHVYSK